MNDTVVRYIDMCYEQIKFLITPKENCEICEYDFLFQIMGSIYNHSVKKLYCTVLYYTISSLIQQYIIVQEHVRSMCPPITYSWTGLLILDHSYLVGNLTNSKIGETKALEPLKF